VVENLPEPPPRPAQEESGSGSNSNPHLEGVPPHLLPFVFGPGGDGTWDPFNPSTDGRGGTRVVSSFWAAVAAERGSGAGVAAHLMHPVPPLSSADAAFDFLRVAWIGTIISLLWLVRSLEEFFFFLFFPLLVSSNLTRRKNPTVEKKKKIGHAAPRVLRLWCHRRGHLHGRGAGHRRGAGGGAAEGAGGRGRGGRGCAERWWKWWRRCWSRRSIGKRKTKTKTRKKNKNLSSVALFILFVFTYRQLQFSVALISWSLAAAAHLHLTRAKEGPEEAAEAQKTDMRVAAAARPSSPSPSRMVASTSGRSALPVPHGGHRRAVLNSG